MRARKPHDVAPAGNVQALRHLDEKLDAALLETFPASDPIAVGRPTATEPAPRPAARRHTAQGDKVRGASPSNASTIPEATRAKPMRKVLRARS